MHWNASVFLKLVVSFQASYSFELVFLERVLPEIRGLRRENYPAYSSLLYATIGHEMMGKRAFSLSTILNEKNQSFRVSFLEVINTSVISYSHKINVKKINPIQ